MSFKYRIKDWKRFAFIGFQLPLVIAKDLWKKHNEAAAIIIMVLFMPFYFIMTFVIMSIFIFIRGEKRTISRINIEIEESEAVIKELSKDYENKYGPLPRLKNKESERVKFKFEK